MFLVEKRGGPDDAKQYAMKLVYADGYTEREFTDAFANEFNVNAWQHTIHAVHAAHLAPFQTLHFLFVYSLCRYSKLCTTLHF